MLRDVARRTHPGWQEAIALASLYGIYELLRGVRTIDFTTAAEHADQIARFEQRVGVFSERAVQQFCEGIPALAHVFAILYPTLHVVGTIGVIVWVYHGRRSVFPFVRTTLIVMTGIALVIYMLYPVAPPRLAISGFVDTVSAHGPLDLSSRFLGRFYNPVAAVPSLHFGYALLAGVAIAWLAQSAAIRIAGGLLPVVTLLVIVATGNHSYFDAATGAAVVLVAAGVAYALVGAPADEPEPPDRAGLAEPVAPLDEREGARWGLGSGKEA